MHRLVILTGASLSACAPKMVTKGDKFPLLYQYPPSSILILPPMNESTAAEAKDYYATTIQEPLSFRGYYVFPYEITTDILKMDGIYDSELMKDIPLWFLREPEAPKNQKGNVQPAYRMQIEGVRFYGMNQGRRVISITADRFTLGRGKIGFFSTGLTRKALFENAIIEIYSDTQAAPPPRATPFPEGGPKNVPSEPIAKPFVIPECFYREYGFSSS